MRLIQQLKNFLTEAKEAVEINKKYSIDKIKHSDSLIQLHTEVDSYVLFEWVYNQVRDKVDFLQYYKGPDSHKVKRRQKNKGKNLVQMRVLSA